MNQILKYYYDIDAKGIKEDNSVYYFNYNNKFFCFALYERNLADLDDIVTISRELKGLNIKCHDIIINKFNKIISVYNNKNYILLCISGRYKNEINIFDMMSINNRITLSEEKKKMYKNNWQVLWENKIDYFENQIRGYAKEKKGILNTFSYYIGMAENAIEYINKINQREQISNFDKISVCHRRIFFPNYELNYLNPISFILDLEVRDYAEYFKAEFFGGENIEQEFSSFLKIKKLEKYSYSMLFARLLFPSYYFDVYEKMLRNEVDDIELINIVNKVYEYENFLRFAYNEIQKYTSIINVPWLINDKKSIIN